MRKTVWITGAGGLIGSYLARTSAIQSHGWIIRPLTRQSIDISDHAGVSKLFSQEQPSLVIHCAALSRSQDCQANPGLAHKLNVEVTERLATLCSDIPFIFFSTDLVFDGRTGNYDEASAPNPLSVYAVTKLAAEEIVLRNPLHTVLRTSLNGGTSPTGDRGFNEQMRLDWQAGRTLRLFTDEYRSPIAAEVTARATWELALKNQPGLYHVAGSERLSRWEIGQLVAQRWKSLNPKLEPASLFEYSGAPRPPDSSLNCSKALKLLSFPFPAFSNWMADHPENEF